MGFIQDKLVVQRHHMLLEVSTKLLMGCSRNDPSELEPGQFDDAANFLLRQAMEAREDGASAKAIDREVTRVVEADVLEKGHSDAGCTAVRTILDSLYVS